MGDSGSYFEGLSSFLHGHPWFTADFKSKPLCNDTSNLHQDDILEDITQMLPSSLMEILPTNHFEMIFWAFCGAVFTTRTLQNIDLLLKPGGFLVAVPANMAEDAEMPPSFELKLLFGNESGPDGMQWRG